MKRIEVTAAIIIKENQVFATQRGYGEFKDWWEFPDFHLTMHCFICTLVSESIHLNEHEAAAWLTRETLDSVRWLPADKGLITKIREII